jgi:hypothetical protein
MLWSRNQNNRNRNFLPWWNRNRIWIQNAVIW